MLGPLCLPRSLMLLIHPPTHTCQCPHLHPSRPSSAATFFPSPCPQSGPNSYPSLSPHQSLPLLTSPPLSPAGYLMQGSPNMQSTTACEAPSFPVAFTPAPPFTRCHHTHRGSAIPVHQGTQPWLPGWNVFHRSPASPRLPSGQSPSVIGGAGVGGGEGTSAGCGTEG